MNTILWSYHSNKTSSAQFSLGATRFLQFYNMEFECFFFSNFDFGHLWE